MVAISKNLAKYSTRINLLVYLIKVFRVLLRLLSVLLTINLFKYESICLHQYTSTPVKNSQNFLLY